MSNTLISIYACTCKMAFFLEFDLITLKCSFYLFPMNEVFGCVNKQKYFWSNKLYWLNNIKFILELFFFNLSIYQFLYNIFKLFSLN